MMEFVKWEYDIPNWMESHKIHVPNHQPDNVYDNTQSVGMIIPNIWKNNPNVPNHQPAPVSSNRCNWNSPIVIIKTSIFRCPLPRYQRPDSRHRGLLQGLRNMTLWLWLTVCHGKSPFVISRWYRWYINDIHNGGTFIEHLYHGELLNNQVGYVTWSSHTGIPMQSEINNYCNWLKKSLWMDWWPSTNMDV